MIAIPAKSTLGDLVGCILKSMKFDDDHLYQVSYRDPTGSMIEAGDPRMDEGPWADQIVIGNLPLEPRQTMELLYDFGDSWRFPIKLERIESAETRFKTPKVLESHGDSSRQYPDWDE